ncbi:pseudouridine synthase [Clostridium zeae]|uniref:Pseudouridine synthase n=1 Tax=Clostridium zeae TaxID=2759022 RepID=A0ABQ1ED70_9CLOT|nr:23S rRNA pseudouridine(2604) synthase RluF [Clostridium zeae]GFZ32694.1 pseudouridine synthase [Clostridium zeae]
MNSNTKKKNVVIHNEKKEELRINKYISETGICSRREADKLIEQGRVSIDGQVATTGAKVGLNQKVLIDGKPITKENEAVYIVLNKPVGITCTTEKKIKGNIVDFVKHKKRIFPIGRLDKDSQGLILLTNDGDIVNKILRAGNNHEKEYIVTVNKPITDEFITNMAKGVPVLGVITKKCVVKREGKNVFRIVLTQGLNRQIRRMCEYFGYKVVKLERIRIMNINLGGLKIGQWRELNRKEIDGINKLISDSVKTEEASTI